ncbi:hypothetical protein DPMN_146327 [Dreissena polymorpha]|uniref:Uncharacterized protein n=1 Tax=Dreissena polymorpha TaxID=45954 RepID=A0A9D4J1Z9_DREPO|nr:hypothetical protein DPMN_146327 [Dreissena polymorpha]
MSYKRRLQRVFLAVGFLFLSVGSLIYRSILYNVHVATFRGYLEISASSTNIDGTGIAQLTLIARMFAEVHALYGIMTVLREGSLLHVYRRHKADADMDTWLIVPRHMTVAHAYELIQSTIQK